MSRGVNWGTTYVDKNFAWQALQNYVHHTLHTDSQWLSKLVGRMPSRSLMHN